MQSMLVQPKRSHNVKGTKLFKEFNQETVYEIYEHLDWLWEVSGFIPCPIPGVAQKFKTTPTHILYVLMAWVESRKKREIYRQSEIS